MRIFKSLIEKNRDFSKFVKDKETASKELHKTTEFKKISIICTSEQVSWLRYN